MSAPSFTELTVQTTDKYNIHVKKFAAKKEAKAQLVIFHGYLEHGGRYAEFADFLAQHDITVYALDCRGHGKSQGQRAYCWNFAQYHLDLDAVLTEAADAKLPLFVLGHSAGGVVVMDYLRTHNPEALSKWWKGVIISSPFLKPAEAVPGWKIWATWLLAYVAPVLTVPANEVTADILTSDEGKRKEHDEDEMNLSVATVGWGYGVQVTQKRLKEWKSPSVGSLPLLLTFGGADKLADPNTAREFFARIESSDKTIDERAGKLHEILNETDREELYAEIKDWILARTK